MSGERISVTKHDICFKILMRKNVLETSLHVQKSSNSTNFHFRSVSIIVHEALIVSIQNEQNKRERIQINFIYYFVPCIILTCKL